ncbi:hypothetical protein BCR35DRAFT_300874 [Leucosporidium creatinivorum]|uniref:E3 ubiquitin-protein ligase n=1 Tax=Leucosporidium creatinivorum TaxID=106004 RepID=A0A1Y2G0S7_9BASI|nr:hypothetical protein BCR35DRAFT_300874 [Leucosporidium creatinivorum]
MLRRPRPSLPPAPPFPPLSNALNVDSASLPAFIDSLSLPSAYSLTTPASRTHLKAAFYSYALDPSSPFRSLLFPDQGAAAAPTLADLNDDWTLSSAQGDRVGGEYSESRRGKVCGHVFRPGESVYRCRDCTLDATCVLCSKCYHGSNHAKERHDVTMSVHAGVGAGCCDCGDAEAFKEGVQGGCRWHSPLEMGEEKVESAEVVALKETVKERLEVLVDWMIEVLQGSPEEMVPPKTVEDIMQAVAAPSPEQETTPHLALPSPSASGSSSSSAVSSPSIPQGSTSTAAAPFDPFTSAMQTDAPSSPSTLRAASPPNYISSTSRGKAREISPSPSPSAPSAAPSEPAGPWSVILWNDEKHSFSQVIDQVNRATGVSRQAAAEVAQRVDTYGRDVIYISSDPAQLLAVTKLIAAIELGVTVRTARETFAEGVVGELVGVLRDLCDVRVGEEGGVLSEVVSSVLLGPWRGAGGEQEAPTSRFQKLVQSDAKLWKEARKGLAEVFVTLLGVSAEVKMELSVQFAQTYSQVAEAYLLTDREPENSIIFFGVQIFTVPSVSAYLVSQHHFLSHLIAILFAFFTEQLDSSHPSGKKHLVLPPNPTIRRIDPESPAFKQKRYFQVFSDLNHLISSPAVQSLICDSSTLMEDFSSFLSLFTSMNPNTRAVNTHVEYESDLWVIAFNVTIQLGKICRSFGEAYQRATPLQLARGLSALLARMSGGSKAAFHAVGFGGTTYQLADFDVASKPVSFHHPLAWLFAEMVKNIDALDEKALETIGVKSLSQIALGRQGQLVFLASMDHPLRVIVLVAQVRVGLWVRNGFAMRAQQLHYKEYSLRENTYDQDIVFLQSAMVILDPSLVLVAILDRFQLLDWLASPSSADHPTFEPAQAMAMAEEMVYLIVIMLSDPTYAGGLSNEAILRRELIHNLCLGSSPYSDLMRRVSEKFADDPALTRILADVSTFKHPVGTADQGTYTLKPECFTEVNPYFPRYSRNQREEAEKIVREQLKKQGGGNEPVIVPKPLGIERGPFVTLAQSFGSDALHRIIFYSMRTDELVLVDEALHLCMLSLVESPAVFASFASNPAPRESSISEEVESAAQDETLLHLLVKIEEDERMKAVRHKAKWCLDRLNELLGPQVNALRKVEDTASPAKALDAKRLAAKARQEAIMKQFAQAQQSFLDSVDDEDDEEDEDEGMEGEAAKPSLGSCIVCQDELDSSRAFGALTFVQTSNIIRLTPEGDNADYQSEILATPSSLDHDASHLRPFGIASQKIPVNADDDSGDGLSKGFSSQHTQSGLFASACGHMMHLACFDTYYKSIEQRHHVQPTRCHPENTTRCEFICPLCKSLGNVLLPATVESEAFDTAVDQHDLAEWAQLAMDPTAAAIAQGAARLAVEEAQQKSRNLQARTTNGVMGLKPWRISLTLPSSVPSEFAGGEPLMTARLLVVLDPLMQEINGGSGVSFIPNELLAYTISALEVASRGQGEAVDAVSDATSRMLKSFLLVLANLVHAQTGLEASQDLAAMAVLPHLGGIFASDKRNSDFFALDPLATIIEAAAVMSSAFHHIVAFAFYTELVRNYLAISKLAESSATVIEHQGDAADKAVGECASLALVRLFFVSPSATGLQSEAGVSTLGKLLYSYTLPFLRRAAIVHRTIFGPDAHDMAADADLDLDESTEFARLLHLLRIPSPAVALRQDVPPSAPAVAAIQAHVFALRDSVPGWRQNLANPAPDSIDPLTSLPLALPESILTSCPPLQHPAIYELIGLPHQLDTLAAESLQRKCERCNQVPADPALCLFCGQIVCSQSFCCMDSEDEAQHGECNMHMWTCGGSIGIYFLIKRNSVLYLYTDKGTFSTPPYLDSHGEVDIGGRRGRNQFPQFLHPGRYDEIRKTWLSHGIPTFVARKLDAVTDHGGWSSL